MALEAENSFHGANGTAWPRHADRRVAMEHLQSLARPNQSLVTGNVVVAANRYAYLLRRKTHLENWNTVSRIYECNDPVDFAALEAAAVELVRHHDGLRLQASITSGVITQWIVAPGAVNPFVAREYLPNASNLTLHEFIRHEVEAIETSFSFPGELFKVLAIVDKRSGTTYLMFVAHHLLVDGYSSGLVLSDLLALYDQLSSAGRAGLPAKTTSIVDYFATSELYWRLNTRIARDAWERLGWDRVQQLPTLADARHEPNLEDHTVFIRSGVPLFEMQELLGRSRWDRDYTAIEVWLAAITKAFRAWTRQQALCLALVIHGREGFVRTLDLSRTVGWIADTAPLVLSLAEDLELLFEVRQQLARIAAKGKSFNLLRHCIADETTAKHPVPQISLNVKLNFPGTSTTRQPSVFYPSATRVTGRAENRPGTARVFLLSGGLYVYEDIVWISWDFSTRLLHPESVQAFTDACVTEFRLLCARYASG